ncbi:hypothetical protein F5Y15DRAFT_371132 [Xylariaceae sp. FL0016]|nr:hypothetical protein F5Y15DRAFT_371132 [Xylariaceae sp. FL0016]
MAPLSMFRFFDLPAEIRSAILSELLVSDCGIVLHNQTLFRLPLTGHKTVLNILLVNMQMYQEASAIFYTQNRFVLNAQSHRLPVHLTGPGGFLSEQARDARRRVQSFTLFLTRIGGEFESTLGPALADMILCGSLRQLRLCLGPPPSQPTSRRGSDSNITQRSPFQSLLRLLSDPYLEAVELKVWKVHWNVFCPFHSHKLQSRDGKPLHESTDGTGLAIIHNGPDWVKLSWKNLVEILGSGQRIVQVGDRNY